LIALTANMMYIHSILIGLSNHRRLLLVAYTERDDTIRIISVRELTLAEQKAYEETKLD
jgi:uncharacterized DUF497 family protein